MNMKKLTVLFITCFVVIFIKTSIYCQHDKRGRHFITLFMNAPTITKISSDVASEIGIANTNWGFDLGLSGRFYRILNVSADIGLGGIKDHQSFTQSTTLGSMESSFNTYQYSFSGGIWTPELSMFKNKIHVSTGINSGLQGNRGKREIDNCRDCKEEKYKFTAGFFVEPELQVFFGGKIFGLGSSYRFLTSDSDVHYKVTVLKLIIRGNL